jgi:undecaprenyl-diphosphatase
MTMFEGLVLGIVQGVTEFLPISSTAHLRIVPALARWRDPGAAFTAVLQLGTLVAVVGYFLPDLLRMVRAALAAVSDRSRPPEPAARQLWHIVPGRFRWASPDRVQTTSKARRIAVTAIALIVGRWRSRGSSAPRATAVLDDIRLRDALIIGCAALALVPGVSRSGITLVAAMAITCGATRPRGFVPARRAGDRGGRISS